MPSAQLLLMFLSISLVCRASGYRTVPMSPRASSYFSTSSSSKPPIASSPREPEENSSELFQALTEFRILKAAEKKTLPWRIFKNQARDGILACVPTSLDELSSVKGIGPMTMEVRALYLPTKPNHNLIPIRSSTEMSSLKLLTCTATLPPERLTLRTSSLSRRKRRAPKKPLSPNPTPPLSQTKIITSFSSSSQPCNFKPPRRPVVPKRLTNPVLTCSSPVGQERENQQFSAT